MESLYTSSCEAQGVKPLPQVSENLQSLSSSLVLSPTAASFVMLKQTDNDFFCLSQLLKQSPPHLQELTLCSFAISQNSLSLLSESLESSKSLQKLSLNSLSLSLSKPFIKLLSSIQSSSSLSYFSLSDNNLEDDSGCYLSALLESPYPLRILDLANNKFKRFSFAASLSKNKNLVSFDMSHNPLEFSNVLSLLEMLTINKTLQHLGLAGMSSQAPAPLKENPSGLLNMNEAVTLKLANVLRYSYIASIAIDIDGTCFMQLKELEISVTKHNRTLVHLEFDEDDSCNPYLIGIKRALKANSWICDKSQDKPTDVEDIINLKLGKKEEFRTSPVKTPQKYRPESRAESDTQSEIVKDMPKRLSSPYTKVIQNISSKMTDLETKLDNYSNKTDCYLEKISNKLLKQKPKDLSFITASIKDIQSKLVKIDQDKELQKTAIQEYMQRLESLSHLEASAKSSKGKDSSQAVSNPVPKLPSIESKVQSIEQASLKLISSQSKLDSSEAGETQQNLSKLEDSPPDSTPKKSHETELKSKMRLNKDSESVVINSLLSQISINKHRGRSIESTKPLRGPSAELRSCLESRGFSIENNRPIFKKQII